MKNPDSITGAYLSGKLSIPGTGSEKETDRLAENPWGCRK